MNLSPSFRSALARLRRLVFPPPPPPPAGDFYQVRAAIAARYLSGNGLEIGALNQPIPLPPAAKARYVHRLTVEELRRHYPEYRNQTLVPVDVVDDGERLATIPDESVDFLIGNHLIEHCEDPIGALRHWLRVVRPGGILYLAAPDKDKTFDQPRPLTPFEHLERDWCEGPAWSRMGHYEEWMALVAKTPAAEVKQKAEETARTGYSIHFHVWTPASFRDFLDRCRRLIRPRFRIVECVPNGLELIVILRRG